MSEIPDYQSFMRPLLEVLSSHPRALRAREVYDLVAAHMGLSEAARAETLPSGTQRTYRNRIGWACTYLRFASLVVSPARGLWQISPSGVEVLAKHAGRIDVSLLKGMPAYQENRKAAESDTAEGLEPEEDGGESTDPSVRLRVRLARTFRQPDELKAALELLAFAIDNADEERADGWLLQEARGGLMLMTGRLVACQLAAGKVRLSVMGPIDPALRAELSMEPDDDFDFKAIPGALLVTFPPSSAARALETLQDSVDSFIDLAMARSKRVISLENHSPDAVRFVGEAVGRELPQPQPSTTVPPSDDDQAEDDSPAAAKVPEARGRAPIFETGNRAVGTLLEEIEQGTIALPDMQRQFVWEDTKVRELLDSLFVGFPVGTLVLWRTTDDRDARTVGSDNRALRATTLVIDGQQRLTSLYAVLRNKPVVGRGGEPRNITIAFRPRDGRFDVADAAIRQDPEYLANVSELWLGPRTKSVIKRELLKGLTARGHSVTDEYADAVDQNLDRAQLISDFRFPTVEIRPTGAATASEEDVAEIFVRINNQGARLGQADFVLTLLSVFHGTLRDRIELRAKEISEESVISLDVQQLLRATCAVAFGRARMSAIYAYLRGVDPNSRDRDPQARARRLDELNQAADRCIRPTLWRDFVLRAQRAGFIDRTLVASSNAVVNGYAFYVLGDKLGADRHRLEETISRWLFGSLLTSRYSGSSETVFEQDLARMRDVTDPNALLSALDAVLEAELSGDYWTRNLVAALATPRSRAPAALAFRAAQVVLGAKALFSDQPVANLLSAPGRAARAASETHHLFPKAYLMRNGITDRRLLNQVANLADVAWADNAAISAQGPAKYVPRLRQQLRISDDQWARACVEHALPPGWESMDYEAFLRERRVRMAHVIRAAFRALGGEAAEAPITPPWFLPGAEVVWKEIAEVERALRATVRKTYAKVHGERAARVIEDSFKDKEKDALERAVRSKPAGTDALSIVEYLYLAQLPPLLFANSVWNEARAALGGREDARKKLSEAIAVITPVRNEIAHVREVAVDRLQRTHLACRDVVAMLAGA